MLHKPFQDIIEVRHTRFDLNNVLTLSPTLNFVTCGPLRIISPQKSRPNINGNCNILD